MAGSASTIYCDNQNKKEANVQTSKDQFASREVLNLINNDNPDIAVTIRLGNTNKKKLR